MTVHQGGGKPGRWACGVKQQPGDGKPGEWVDCPECQRVFSWDSTSERIAAIDAANAANVVADITIARLTRERDEARAVAQDKGLDACPEWMREVVARRGEIAQALWVSYLDQCGLDERYHSHSAWANQMAWDLWSAVAEADSVRQQVDASHEAALVEERRLADLARESADYAQNYESDGSDSVGPRL